MNIESSAVFQPFSTIPTGSCFKIAGGNSKAGILMKTDDLLRYDGLIVNAVYLHNGAYVEVGKDCMVEPLPNAHVVI